MCFDLDARPPIAPIEGGALDTERLVLAADDGNRLRAFAARAAEPSGAGMLVLPDVRGLHPYYEELALRFAEHGVDAVAIDYFGRTAGSGDRPADFDHMGHVSETTFAGLSADVRAGLAHLRTGLRDSGSGDAVRSAFTVGFCFGGRLAFLTSTLGLGLAGAIGFYGIPAGPGRNDMPAPLDVTGSFRDPVLGLFGGADAAIPRESIAAFDAGLTAAGIDHDIHVYDGAPHSFFDRKAADHAEASADAWERVLGFVRARSGRG